MNLLPNLSILGQATNQQSWYSVIWGIPVSIILLLLVAFVTFVVMIYKNERGKPGQSIRVVLSCIRILLIGSVLFFLLGWMHNKSLTDLPDLVIAIDVSQSMSVKEDLQKEDFNPALLRELELGPAISRLNLVDKLLTDQGSDWVAELSKSYNLKVFEIGRSAKDIQNQNGDWNRALLNLEADQSESRLGDGLSQILQTQRGRPTTAVLLFSDGIVTGGSSLSEFSRIARNSSIPIFPIGIGNDAPPKDVSISDLSAENVVFSRDLVTFDFKVSSIGYEDSSATVRLKIEGVQEPVAQQTIKLTGKRNGNSVRLTHRPQEQGQLQFEVEIETLDGEASNENNILQKTVQVRDEQIKVLLVADNPSREFHYVKQLLTRSTGSDAQAGNRAVEFRSVLQQADIEYASTDETALKVFPVRREELFEYDVLILMDASVAGSGTRGGLGTRELDNIYDFVTDLGKGLVVISGPVHFDALNGTPAEPLLPYFPDSATAPEEDDPLIQSHTVVPTGLGWDWAPFQLGDSESENRKIWSNLPGFHWALKTPNLRPGTRVLASHPSSIGEDGASMPFISMQFIGNGKVVFQSTGETYRWRFRQRDRYFGRYWLQLIRYLSNARLNSSEDNISITTNRDVYKANESISVNVRFLDDRKAPAADDGVKAILKHDSGARETIGFSRNSLIRGQFNADLENLSPGGYQVSIVEPTSSGRPAVASFSVVDSNSESVNLTMDARQLKNLAESTNGKFFTVYNANELLDEIPVGRRIELSSLPPTAIWDQRWIVLLFGFSFIALISLEWVVRRSIGMI